MYRSVVQTAEAPTTQAWLLQSAGRLAWVTSHARDCNSKGRRQMICSCFTAVPAGHQHRPSREQRFCVVDQRGMRRQLHLWLLCARSPRQTCRKCFLCRAIARHSFVSASQASTDWSTSDMCRSAPARAHLACYKVGYAYPVTRARSCGCCSGLRVLSIRSQKHRLCFSASCKLK